VLLLSLESSVRFMITAAVLLAAVVLDSLSRRGPTSHGRAWPVVAGHRRAL